MRFYNAADLYFYFFNMYVFSCQVIVQRLLAVKSLSHAQGAALMAGFIKVLPLFMMVMPGMISRVLYADEVACVDPQICNYVCQSEAGCSSIAYPRLVLGIMPEGLRGLMMSLMIAALMSDIDSIFNSASTLFTVYVYTKIRKNCSQREQMFVGR
ncbi:sodium/myo-inositol cotransporter-like [Ruditapes philippinarum]|uniref:sodium/myo-inositol cotransporter-like n=1 Tax=Ruditapes philippinarum TaxID=129788 RepID=UPI00295AAEB8|nr:sodium/myo-inositol cotransporter-like [Ruditapes philippinarum]